MSQGRISLRGREECCRGVGVTELMRDAVSGSHQACLPILPHPARMCGSSGERKSLALLARGK